MKQNTKYYWSVGTALTCFEHGEAATKELATTQAHKAWEAMSPQAEDTGVLVSECCACCCINND